MTKILKLAAIIMLALIQVNFAESSFFINEIMYNPPGNDNNKEFVEIRGTNNLSGMMIGDLVFNDSLELLFFVPDSEYALIVEEGFNYTGLNCSIYSAGATIGDNLDNEGDTIFLWNSQNLTDSVTYTNEYANGNGKSLELDAGIWKESLAFGGTPCHTNSVTTNQTVPQPEPEGYDIELSAIIAGEVYLFTQYNSLFRVKNLDYVSGNKYDIIVAVEYNITRENNSSYTSGIFEKIINYYTTSQTGSFFPQETGNFTLCGRILSTSLPDPNQNNDYSCKNFTVIDPRNVPCNVSIGLDIEKTFYEDKEKVVFYNTLSDKTFPYIIRYSIRDIFGAEIRNLTTENTNQKSFTPSIERELNVFFISNQIEFLACNNSNTLTSSETYVIVLNPGENKLTSTIELLDANPGISKPAKFGEYVNIKVAIYKGDTAKKVVDLEIGNGKQKAGKQTKVTIDEKMTGAIVTIPILIEPNCDGKLPDGTYTITASGLDAVSKIDIDISGIAGSICPKQQTTATAPAATRQTKNEPEILSFYTRIKNYYEQARFYGRVKGSNLTIRITNVVFLPNISNEKAEFLERQPMIVDAILNQAALKTNYNTQILFDETIHLDKSINEHSLDINISLAHALNNITLFLISQGSVVAESSIIMDFSSIQEKVSSAAKTVPNKTSPPIIQQETPKKPSEIVYMSKTKKLQKYINYFLVFVFCLAVYAYSRSKWIKNRLRKQLKKVMCVSMSCLKSWATPKNISRKRSGSTSLKLRRILRF